MDIKGIWKKHKKMLIPFLFTALGVTPAVFIKVGSNLQQNIKHFRVSNQVYSAGFRSSYRLDYTGKVDIYKITLLGRKLVSSHDIEVRSTYTYDDFKKDMLPVEWIFVIEGGGAAMYEAVYSPIWRSYHFVDKNGTYQWVYDLKKIE